MMRLHGSQVETDVQVEFACVALCLGTTASVKNCWLEIAVQVKFN